MSARRLVRPPRSRYRIGDPVIVDGDSAGDYHGTVIARIGALCKPDRRTGQPVTQPGVVVAVHRWDSTPEAGLQVTAHDQECRTPSAYCLARSKTDP